jgi:thiamine-phosphate diphosphorylase
VIDRSAAREGFAQVAEAVAGGVDWLQVRERELSDAALAEFAEGAATAAREGARRAGRKVRVVVNRRGDVALAVGADGVHLGFDALAPASARRLLGEDALVGVSCHQPEEIAAAEGASYAHLAPIFAPLSKAATREPLGVGALARARGARPVLAQGGITAENAPACLAAGAAGVAVTGAILQAADPGAAARSLRQALDGAVGSRS